MPATILCVEDEQDLRSDICEELEAAGYAVMEADNGREALELMREKRPDLVLCDITMPLMSGLDLLGLVRKEPALADLPFVFLTALAGRRDIIAGKAAGVDDYLTKPIDFDLMLITIAARLDQVERVKGAVIRQDNDGAGGGVRSALLGANEALHHVAVGIFLLDDQRKVVFRNRRADELLAEADGISLSRDGVLRGEKPQQTQAMRNIIDVAITSATTGTRQANEAVALSRSSGRRSLFAVACPLGRGPARPGEPVVGLFVTDPERRLSAAAEAVAQLYGLSPAETRLALALARGMRLDEIADEFGISRNTVSYTMKNLFRKTETDRQADLISLFIASPVALEND
jgi:DNA-binding response OmpR family regulator/DNA-binding CsgD family transcriptional regulator